MMDEAKQAKENGLTYDMYKAGASPRHEQESGYVVHQTEILRKTVKDDSGQKPIAIIKRGIRI